MRRHHLQFCNCASGPEVESLSIDLERSLKDASKNPLLSLGGTMDGQARRMLAKGAVDVLVPSTKKAMGIN